MPKEHGGPFVPGRDMRDGGYRKTKQILHLPSLGNTIRCTTIVRNNYNSPFAVEHPKQRVPKQQRRKKKNTIN